MKECWINVYKSGAFGIIHYDLATAVSISDLIRSRYWPDRVIYRIHVRMKQ